MTFSIAARCMETGQFGVAICSSSPAVAARCAHVRTGVGAACSQNITDPSLGNTLLNLLQHGMTATAALEEVVQHRENISYRQLTVVDRQGGAAAYSGEHCLGTVETFAGAGVIAAGNLLADRLIPRRMVEAFEPAANRHLGDRLLAGLTAAQAAGGEEGPVHSAGLIIVDAVAWPATDLRVDWSDDPIGELVSLWRLWRPQIDAYVKRAVDPANSPSYGVPGDSQ